MAAKSFKMEHRVHEGVGPHGDPYHSEADYGLAACPACGAENTILAMVGPAVHMRQELKCLFCGADLPYQKEVESTIGAAGEQPAASE